jgi:hypothetical protein
LLRDANTAAGDRQQNGRHHRPEQKRGRQPDGLQAESEQPREDDQDRPLLAGRAAGERSVELQTAPRATRRWRTRFYPTRCA